jgi:EpsI family protein
MATALIVVFGAFGNYLRFNKRMPDRLPVFESIPYTIDGYYGEERRFSQLSYDVLQADTTTLRLYRDADGTSYWLFVAYFSSQKYGSQIHSPKHCLPGGGWKIEKIEPFLLRFADNSTKEINRLIIGRQKKKQVMFYWFETRGGTINDEFGLKWDLMKNSLLLRPTDAAFIRLTIPTELNKLDQATAKAVAFFNTFYPDIKQALPF